MANLSFRAMTTGDFVSSIGSLRLEDPLLGAVGRHAHLDRPEAPRAEPAVAVGAGVPVDPLIHPAAAEKDADVGAAPAGLSSRLAAPGPSLHLPRPFIYSASPLRSLFVSPVARGTCGGDRRAPPWGVSTAKRAQRSAEGSGEQCGAADRRRSRAPRSGRL